MSTHQRRLVPVGLVVLAAALVGCGDVTGEDPPAVGTGSAIDGEYVSDGAPNPPFRDGSEPIRLTLRDGEISFTASCNQFSGQATLDDGVLRTSTLGGTEMGCPGVRQTQDEWMIDFFGSAPALELDGTDLAVRSDTHQVWFVPEDEVASDEPGDEDDLIGTHWRLTGIGETDGDSIGMMVIPDDVTATIRFADGGVRIRPGCNQGGGPVRIEAGTITFSGGIALSAAACPDARGAVERDVMRVLDGPVSWSISGDELRLRTSDGRHELVFHR